jgi:hypothetical protein
MGNCISRRDFIRTSSIAGVVAAINPSVSSAASEKSRVVIAADTSVINSSGTTIDSAKATEMIDNAIMTLTGKTTKAAAYEAIFPAPVTTSTKILLKRNDISGNVSTNATLVNALKTGLTSMLNGTFPANNITIRCTGGDGSSATSAATYIINCPVCVCHQTDYGVTLSLKNTMPYLGNPSSKYHSANKAWLYNVSLDPAIKPKQVLSFLDATTGYNGTGGPTTNRNWIAGKIIVGRDLVAVDYQALRLMEKQTSPQTSRIATADAQLVAAQTAKLGTCTPSNMEVINISPPWNATGIIGEQDSLNRALNVAVSPAGQGYQFSLPAETGGTAELEIFDCLGHRIWSTNEFTNHRTIWQGTTSGGVRVPAGMYVYRVFSSTGRVKGIVMIR